MLRNVLSVFAGLVTFVFVVSVLQTMMMRAYPLPPGIDPSDIEALKRAIAGMPAGAFGLLLAGYGVGAMCGGAVASALARERRMVKAAIVGGVTTLAGIANFVQLPHPTWVVVVGLPLFMVTALAGGRLGIRLTR